MNANTAPNDYRNTEHPMRQPSPILATRPSPSGKYPSFAAYIAEAIRMVGTAEKVGNLLGFTSGTRVNDWRKAKGGGPSLESCLRLAKLTGDDPLDILAMTGHDEIAELLKTFLSAKVEAPVAMRLKPTHDIDSAIAALEYAKKMLEDA
jgi:hypothetical protein